MTITTKPSQAWSWVNCHGQPKLLVDVPPIPEKDDRGEAAKEGTAAHEFAAQMAMTLKGVGVSPVLGDKSTTGVLLTHEMFMAILEYFKHIADQMAGSYDQLTIEQKLSASDMFGPNLTGTPDLYAIDHKIKQLFMRDYKHGFGLVEVYENWQQIIYAGMLSERFSDSSYKYDLGIVQPRGFHPEGTIRTWLTNERELQPYWDRVKAALDDIYGSDKPPQLVAGPWCKRCPARLGCKTNAKATGEGLDYGDRAHPVNMSDEEKSIQWLQIRDVLKTLQSRMDALEVELIESYSEKRQQLAYVDIRGSTGRKRWKTDVDVDTIINLGKMSGKDLAQPVKTVTPTQAINMGVPELIVNQMSEQPDTGWKLKPADTSFAQRVFSPKETSK